MLVFFELYIGMDLVKVTHLNSSECGIGSKTLIRGIWTWRCNSSPHVWFPLAFLNLMKGCWLCLWNHTFVQSDCLGCFLTKKFVEYARSSLGELDHCRVIKVSAVFPMFSLLADECNNLERSLQKNLVFKKTCQKTKKHIHTHTLTPTHMLLGQFETVPSRDSFFCCGLRWPSWKLR